MYFTPRLLQHIFFATLLTLALDNKAEAQFKKLTDQISDSQDSIGREYYTIADPEEEYKPDLFTPLSALKAVDAFQSDFLVSQNNIPAEQNLLDWVFHETQNPDTPERYQRKNHFGTWLRDPSSKTCLNVRGLVLQRDALGEITYADERHCRITASRWIDPYSNTEVTSADDIQIDHVVPLKNAYISGAWAWTRSQRCNYSNFMGNGFHLLAVLGIENNRKSDSTPEKYIPPQAEFVCQYLVNWLKIKSIWRLKLAKNEALAIERELKTYNCNVSDFQLDWNELHTQRSRSLDFPKSCTKESTVNSDRNIPSTM